MSRAFLVIDIQNDYFPGGGPAPVAGGGGDRGAPRGGDRTGAGAGGPDRPRPACLGDRDGTVRARFARHRHPPAIREAAGDAPVVIKRHADAFQETGLAGLLAGTDTLVVAG